MQEGARRGLRRRGIERVLPFHHAGAANRQQLQAVNRFPQLFAEERRTHAQPEFIYLHPAELRRYAVPGLMHQYKCTETQNCQQKRK